VGEEDRDALNMMYYLALLYLDQGKYAEAEPLFARVLEVWRRILGPQHPLTALALGSLGELRLGQRQYSDAEPFLHEALIKYEKLPDGWRRYRIQSLLGGSLAGQRKYIEAEPLLLSGYQGMIQRQGAAPIEARPDVEGEQAGERIVQLYLDWGKPEQASEWQSKLQARKAASLRQQ
jgi:tetratricopeptide (TPR) repeat protein